MKRLISALVIAGGLAAVAASAHAEKIVVGYTGAGVWVSAFIAKDKGLFEKRGLDVDLLFIQLNSTMPQALVSNSIQVGLPTPPVLIQANDAGLDLVAIAGATVTGGPSNDVGAVARTDSGVKTPQDFVGKRVGVPGLGAFLHVMFRHWLQLKGVDYNKVIFVEIAFPQAPDVLKSGTVDAVITADPFLTKIVNDKTGYVVGNFLGELPPGIASGFFTTTRDWAKAHAKDVKEFQAAIVEAAELGNKDEAVQRDAIGHYIKLPPPVIANMRLTPLKPVIDPQEIRFWFDVMKAQKMLNHDLDVDAMIWK
jgi:NitT/TauT family transport system substrate-binding protein